MVEIHPTIEIHKRFPPSTPQYSPIDLCYTSEIYFLSTKFHPKLMLSYSYIEQHSFHGSSSN
jgi:hypothetical protein